MYIVAILQIVFVILILFLIVQLIRKKWKTLIYLGSTALIVLLIIFLSFTSTIGLNVFYGFRNTKIEFIDTISIDGKLNEAFWHLENKDMYLLKEWVQPAGNKMTSNTPSFQFLRDSLNIYFGYMFDTRLDTAKAIAPENLHLSLRLSAFNSDLSHFRLAFAPFNESAEPSGWAFCDCPKCRLVTNYQFASQFENGIWTYEFSIPFSEVMNKRDKFLRYKFTFVNKLQSIEEVSSYPAPDEQYKEYFVIK